MDTLSITLGTAMDGLAEVMALGLMIAGAALLLTAIGLAAWLLAKSREADDDDYANVFDD